MKKETTKTQIVLPKIQFADVCCGECRFGGYNSTTDKILCKKDRSWHDWDDSCSNFVEE